MATSSRKAQDLGRLLETVEAAQREIAAGTVAGGMEYHDCARIAGALDKALDPYRCRACQRPHVALHGSPPSSVWSVCSDCRAGRPAGSTPPVEP